MALVFLTSDQELIGQENLELIGQTFAPLIMADLVEIEIELLPPKEMRQLNLQQRQVDHVTDVLSFPIFASLQEVSSEIPVLLGSIVICPEEAVLRLETLPQLVVHGILHLIGNDHETDREAWLKLEDQVLQELSSKGMMIAGIESW